MALNANAPQVGLRQLAHNAALNLLGHLAPLAAALAAFPYLATSLGAERFGLLALAWVLVGYFSLFDLGLGRALTRALAGSGLAASDARAVTHSALGATLLLGVAAGAVLALLSQWLCTRVLQIPPSLQGEAVTALRVLAACLPFVTLTAGLRGILEAHHRFGWVNAIRIPLGFLTFLAPMAAAAATQHMVWLALSLAAVRVAGAAAHLGACAVLFPGLLAAGAVRLASVKALLIYGSWLTVSNIVGPLMVYLDRFVIGAAITLAAVAYYSAPYEIVTRLWLVPAALCGVLFPALAGHVAKDSSHALHLYRWGIKAVLVCTYPLGLLLALLAPEWLHAWLGPEYARNSAAVARILAIGILANCLAYLPFTLLQAEGRADVVAKLHLVELPLYLLALWVLARGFGIEGAAIAWLARSIGDSVALFALVLRKRRFREPVLGRSQWLTAPAFLLLVGVGLVPEASLTRWIYAVVALGAFLALVWTVWLDREERALLRDRTRPLLGIGTWK